MGHLVHLTLREHEDIMIIHRSDWSVSEPVLDRLGQVEHAIRIRMQLPRVHSCRTSTTQLRRSDHKLMCWGWPALNIMRHSRWSGISFSGTPKADTASSCTMPITANPPSKPTCCGDCDSRKRPHHSGHRRRCHLPNAGTRMFRQVILSRMCIGKGQRTFSCTSYTA